MPPDVSPSIFASRVRAARVGDVLPRRLLHPDGRRRLDAAAIVVPGQGAIADYLSGLGLAAARFAEWDGRLVVLDPDGQTAHRLAVVDRYGQVYETHDAETASGLPAPDTLADWFRFLATACPECGVIDDPRPRTVVP